MSVATTMDLGDVLPELSDLLPTLHHSSIVYDRTRKLLISDSSFKVRYPSHDDMMAVGKQLTGGSSDLDFYHERVVMFSNQRDIPLVPLIDGTLGKGKHYSFILDHIAAGPETLMIMDNNDPSNGIYWIGVAQRISSDEDVSALLLRLVPKGLNITPVEDHVKYGFQ